MASELSKVFSDNLNRLIAKRNITQLELSRYMHVSASTVSGWVSGEKSPRMGKIDKICKYFGVEREALLTDQSARQDPLILNAEEKQLINNYRNLELQNQQAIFNMINAFLTQQAAAIFGNVINNSNCRGNFKS